MVGAVASVHDWLVPDAMVTDDPNAGPLQVLLPTVHVCVVPAGMVQDDATQSVACVVTPVSTHAV